MADFRPLIPNISRLAESLGCDYSHLHSVLKGGTRPGPQFAIRIEEATNGAIRRGDLRPDLWPSNHCNPPSGEAA